jgi:hypothetical protein
MKKLFIGFFGIILFVQSNAQLQEIGRYDDYALSTAIALKDRVYVNKHDGYDQGYYTTTDFRNFTPASYPFEDAYLGQFVKDGELYFITRTPYEANPQYILRLNEQNDFDTLCSFTGFLASEVFIIGSSDTHVYFKKFGDTRRFDFTDSTVKTLENIPPDLLRRYAITDTSIICFPYLNGLPISWISTNKTQIRRGKINLDDYYVDAVYPQIRHNGMFMMSYLDTLVNSWQYCFTNGDTVLNCNPFPQPFDTSFTLTPFNATINYDLPYTVKLGDHAYNFEQVYLPATGWKRESQNTNIIRHAWWKFDSNASELILIDDSTHFYTNLPESQWEVFILKNGRTAFGLYQDAGHELISFNSGKRELLHDIYPGMGSGLYLDNDLWGQSTNHITHNGYLFFFGIHPYWGQTLYRSDGSTEGTGPIAAIGERFSYVVGTRLFPIGNKLFVFAHGEGRYVYEINQLSSYITEPPLLNPSSFWNRSIYTRIYRDAGGSSGSDMARSSYKSGLVLQQTQGMNLDYFVYPEDQRYSPLIDYRKPYGTTAITVHDTNGILVADFLVHSWSSQAALHVDSSLVIFVKHKNESRTSFDTILNPGERTYLRRYSLDKQLLSSTILPFNFRVFKLQTDSRGFTYITGMYEDKQLDLNNLQLTSDKEEQYFVAAFNKELQTVWAKNLNLPTLNRISSFTDIEVDSESGIVYTLFNEGWVYSDPEDGDELWQGGVSAFNSTTGKLLWQTIIETDGTSSLKGITKTTVDEIWIAGNISGRAKVNQRPISNLESGGALIVLNGSNGTLKRSYTKPEGWYVDVSASSNSVYSIWYSASRTLSGNGIAADDKFYNLTFEQRDLSGILQREYVNPIMGFYRDEPYFDLYPEINNKNDWMLFSVNYDNYPLSDSLHFANMSSGFDWGSTLLMRRPGQIFKDLPPQNLAGWNPEEPVAYPNPVTSNDVFIGSLQQDVPYNAYELISLDGRVIDSGTIDQVQWPLHLKFTQGLRGMYILRLDGGEGSKSFKLVFNSY